MLGKYKGDTTNDESLMDEDMDYIDDEEADEARQKVQDDRAVESILLLRKPAAALDYDRFKGIMYMNLGIFVLSSAFLTSRYLFKEMPDLHPA